MEWPQETVARLRQFWGDGMSITQIGVRLGVTRNAVVGKAHRLDLPSRQSPIRRDPNAPRLPRKPRAPRTGVVSLPRLSSLAAPMPSLPKLRMRSVPMKRKATWNVMRINDVPREERKPLVNAPFYTCGCYWPVGNNGKYALYCDAKITRGAFCEEHAKRAYVGGSFRAHRNSVVTKDQIMKIAA